ncbi:MAG: ribosome biogenesis GTPase YlqF [Bacillota bacterium]|jgi:ribosome biogenesis GTPase A
MTIIQWYPGHMAKAKRNMEQDIAAVDLSIVVLDARIPFSSYNPDFNKILKKKPILVVLNKADLANKTATAAWIKYYESRGLMAVAMNSQKKQGMQELLKKAVASAEPVMLRLEARGRRRRPVRAMVVGSPNTGKSTLINAIMPKAASKTGNKPGVTRGKQWVRINDKIELLDTPGVLWPKFEDPKVGFALAVTGAISSDVYDTYDVALKLIDWLCKIKPTALTERYKIELETEDNAETVIEKIGRARGMLASGGVIRVEDAAKIILAEFRNGKLGCFTLDMPKTLQKQGQATEAEQTKEND